MNANETIELTDLKPIGEIKGGPAANTYTGATTIVAGTLSVDSSSSNSFYGTGVYKSTDSVRTWT